MKESKEDKRAKWMKKKARKDIKIPSGKIHIPANKKKPKHKRDMFQ